MFNPSLSLVFFYQSSSSPAFLTSLLTQSSHLSIGLPRLLLPCSRMSTALSGSLSPSSFQRVMSTVVCSSPVSLSSSSALLSLPLTPPFVSSLPSLLLLFFVLSCFRTLARNCPPPLSQYLPLQLDVKFFPLVAYLQHFCLL